MMNQKEKNSQAVEAYLDLKNPDVNNGLTRLLNANISYTNHKSGKVTIIFDAFIVVSYDIQFDCYRISISALQDVDGCFVDHNTNFSVFQYNDDQLHIVGKDNTGNKGDYTLVLL